MADILRLNADITEEALRASAERLVEINFCRLDANPEQPQRIPFRHCFPAVGRIVRYD